MNSGGVAPGDVKVMGALLGNQSGRTVDISNSFEIKFEMADGSPVIDHPFLLKKQEQCEWYRACCIPVHARTHGPNPMHCMP